MEKNRLSALAISIVVLIGAFSVKSFGAQETTQGSVKEHILGFRTYPPGVLVPLEASSRGFRRCVTKADYEDPNNVYGWCEPMLNNIAYTSDYCLGYAIYAYSSELGDKYTWKYFRPDGQLYTTDYWEYVFNPTINRNVYRASNGLEFLGPTAVFYGGFKTTNMPYLGEWRVEVYYNTTLAASENFFIEPALNIRMPTDNLNYSLEQDNYTRTPDIPFMAEVDPGCGSSTQSIEWTLNLDYHTSVPANFTYNELSPLKFISPSGEVVTQTYKSPGGLLTVHASAIINGEKIDAQPVTITITGPEGGIPDGLIDIQLEDLYNEIEIRPTPHLMIGLAWEESSYAQFYTMDLFGRTLKWPHESEADHGSHIGLMMVVMQMDRAWDWLVNTAYGGAFFLNDKTVRARDNEEQIINYAKRPPAGAGLHSVTLCNLTAKERENMTLECYGDHAHSDARQHYYFYKEDPDPNR